MRKILCMICSLLILVNLAACMKQPTSDITNESTTNNTTAASDSTTSPNETTIPASAEDIIPGNQQPMVAVSMPMQTESLCAEDGNVVLNYNSQYMMLSMSDSEVAERITLEFLNRIDATSSTKNAILESAKSAYSTSTKWTPYQYTVAYTPKRVDSGVLSLLGCDVSYLGAHIEKVYHSVNYSMTTGYTLSLLNIITSQSCVDTLRQYVIEALNNNRDQLALYEDFETTVTQHFSGSVNDAWYFSPDGLCFFFSPYDIAPYSAGVVIAEIPYEKLTGILKDDYFPAERANAAGKILLKYFNEDTALEFTNFSELALTSNEQKLLLYTDQSAYDISIDVGTRSSNGMFLGEYTAFAQSSLTSGEAIMLEADIDTQNVLQISYRSGTDTVIACIMLDPATNQIVLTES